MTLTDTLRRLWAHLVSARPAHGCAAPIHWATFR